MSRVAPATPAYECLSSLATPRPRPGGPGLMTSWAIPIRPWEKVAIYRAFVPCCLLRAIRTP